MFFPPNECISISRVNVSANDLRKNCCSWFSRKTESKKSQLLITCFLKIQIYYSKILKNYIYLYILKTKC